MTQKELLTELRRSALLDNLRCLGCGYEHSCSIHGCAIILAAVEHIEQLAAENTVLREAASPPNPPLTLEELREMDGEPVWLECITDNRLKCWGFHAGEFVRGYIGYFVDFYDYAYGEIWLAYRRKTEDVSKLDTIPGGEG